jgi:hypothetical protein
MAAASDTLLVCNITPRQQKSVIHHIVLALFFSGADYGLGEDRVAMDDDVDVFRVAGVSFYQEALERCSAGEAVRFIHEPDNPHDPTAIRVVSILGETVGYVPRKAWVHHAVHQLGRGVSGVFASIGYSRACLLGATISVAVCDDAPAVASYYPDRPAPEAPQGGFRYWIKTPSDALRLVAARK